MTDASVSSSFTPSQRRRLLQAARDAIEHGLRSGTPPPLNPDDHDPVLRQPRGVFVTLHVRGELHGCIGTLEPASPLVCEVARCAFSAAFADPRFTPCTRDDLPDLDIHLSVLSPLEPMTVADEPDLLQQLRPGTDGLVLEASDGRHRATFLPAVWEKLPDPREFVIQLKLKAGLNAHDREADLRWSRYTAESIP